MTTFMDQVSETSVWSNPGPPSGFPDDHRVRELPRVMLRNRRVALLARVVQNEVLPRLIVARAVGPAPVPTSTTEADTLHLVGLLLTQPASHAVAFVEGLRASGASLASLYLGIIAEAARQLGVLWEDDRCGFAEMTIGVGHLQQVIRALSPQFQTAAVALPHADTILLLPAPGDQHTVGLVILSEFFQREGWHVAGGPVSSVNDAAALVSRNWVDVVGFSIGSEHLLDGLKTCIAAVRKASRNKHISVMVGGPMLLVHPDLAKRTGADAASNDAPSAVREARALLSYRAAAD